MTTAKVLKLEERLTEQKGAARANLESLEAAKNEYTNQIKGGKHPDSLTGLSLQLAEFTTRQTGLDLAAQMTGEELEAARKRDASPEMVKTRKDIIKLKSDLEGRFREAEKNIKSLTDQLRELELAAQEYSRMYYAAEGIRPDNYRGKADVHILGLLSQLEIWEKQHDNLNNRTRAHGKYQEPNKGKVRPPQPKYRSY